MSDQNKPVDIVLQHYSRKDPDPNESALYIPLDGDRTLVITAHRGGGIVFKLSSSLMTRCIEYNPTSPRLDNSRTQATRGPLRRVYDFVTRAHTKAFVVKFVVTLAAVTAFRRLAPQYGDTILGGFIVAMACLLAIDALLFLWRRRSNSTRNDGGHGRT